MIITKEQQQYWINNYIKEKHSTDECVGFIDGIQRVMDNINSLQVNSWQDATKSQPKLNDENHSENVLAICNGSLMVMCYCYNPSEYESERGFFWANCYGNIEGDAEFDDEYDVTFWQYLPSTEGFV